MYLIEQFADTTATVFDVVKFVTYPFVSNQLVFVIGCQLSV
jgi:hypothetical protein